MKANWKVETLKRGIHQKLRGSETELLYERVKIKLHINNHRFVRIERLYIDNLINIHFKKSTR